LRRGSRYNEPNEQDAAQAAPREETMIRIRPLLAFVGVATALRFLASDADARVGRGGSFGSRGGQTYSAPPTTRTAPNQAAPIERSMTQPGQQTTGVARPGAPAPAATGAAGRGGLFGGLAGRGGFFGGLLGAGLIGMLLGYGLAGGLGSLGSILGLLLQVGLIMVVAALIVRWWQNRQQQRPAYAGMPQQMHREDTNYRRLELGGAAPGATTPGATTPGMQGDVQLQKEDFDAFERLLGEIQAAYGNEDLGKLRGFATPEMLSYFAEELADNASRGVVNQVSDVKLLQGDLSEAWREGNVEYATVAMTFSLVERTVERAGGRVVDGGDQPIEITELWTFMRSRGGSWLLSAIQQA
jgi:predicted lipid-binding transport protein (Tim44 family)